MNSEDLAKMLTGSEYPLRLSKDIKQLAKDNGLVIVRGGSDDLMMFDGAINDEVGVFDGGIALVYKGGLLEEREQMETDEELEIWFNNKKVAKQIEAFWDRGEYTWSYESEIPHSTFEVKEDDEVYCLGMVFSINDL